MLALLPLLLAAPQDLYQISTYGAFASGRYDGVHRISELASHGDFGLGTFNGLDGEMVVLDGRVNRISGFGDATQPSGETKTPFAFVTDFRTEKKVEVPRGTDLTALIDRLYPEQKSIVAIRFDGDLDLTARSFAPQPKPYRPLASILDRQSVFPYGHVSGTLVGFRMPKSVAPVNVPGYHFHFISKNRRFGGHVLNYRLGHGTLSLMTVRRIVQL